MAAIGLEAQPREQTGKGIARRLRREGMVPAVIYGVGDPAPLAVSRKEIERPGLRLPFLRAQSDGESRATIDPSEES